MAQAPRPMASYTPKAMRAEADELKSMALMDKAIAREKAAEAAKMPARIREGAAKIKAMKKMAKGGSASKRADGCAQRGKTKGKMV